MKKELLILAMLLVAIACSAKSDDPRLAALIGAWDLDTVSTQPGRPWPKGVVIGYFIFNRDGSLQGELNGGDEMQIIHGTYSIKGNQLIINNQENSIRSQDEFALENDGKTLRINLKNGFVHSYKKRP